MATFNETRAPISRKYVGEQGIVITSWSKTFQTFWSHSSFCALEKQPEKLIFRVFLTLKDSLVATLNETSAPTSRKYVAQQGIVMRNWSKTFQSFWLHSSVSTLEKQSEKLKFQSFF